MGFEQATLLIERLAAIGVVISSSEWLVARDQLHPTGLLGWDVACLRHALFVRRGLASALGALFSYPNVLVLVVLRGLSACLLIVGPPLPLGVRIGAAFMVAITSALIGLRCPFGLDGADQMTTFIFGTLFLALLSSRLWVLEVFVWALAVQSCLSYSTAGIAKLTSQEWRSGSAIASVWNTRIYGWSRVGAPLRAHPKVSLCVGWSLIAFECLFFVSLFGPRPATIAVLAIGVIFHATSAVVMGLNTFFWAFIATYPAIYCCAIHWH
jgi:hypothetical protein